MDAECSSETSVNFNPRLQKTSVLTFYVVLDYIIEHDEYLLVQEFEERKINVPLLLNLTALTGEAL
jgi:hypothetical protein